METAEKTREIRLRRAAKRQGLTLHRSRVRDPRALSYARYRLERDGHVIAGGEGTGYSMTMDDIERYLNGDHDQAPAGPAPA
ncbi:hypothetical protein ACI2LJ_35995 [Streptomyces sp. NPDC088090]|uniref:hypothetical protein n=1 Tax=Streptomyces sp. NPDC088090 TaxID=3365822 RepID=UPI00385001DC